MEKINPGLKSLIKPISFLKPDPKNARKHDAKNIKAIMNSFQAFGQQKPIVAMTDGTIIAGNGTLEALKKLGWEKVAVVTFDSEEKAVAAAFAIADNRTAELATWDLKNLEDIVASLPKDPPESLGIDLEEINAELLNLEIPGQEKYSKKIDTPVYTPKGDKPKLSELVNYDKQKSLTDKIQAAKIPEEEKAFLRAAAARHAVFDYHLIAEYYCHASPETKALMEDSALVIIDFDKAIENGYVQLNQKLAGIYSEAHGDEDDEA